MMKRDRTDSLEKKQYIKNESFPFSLKCEELKKTIRKTKDMHQIVII